ncbi:Mob1/phocein [Infundibulicybe gibba]|nr:Mob1/phocein [Infundibulicybe gibba]
MAVLLQRPLRGSRISSFYPIKSLPPLASLDSAFQLQEYISLLIRLDVHDVEAIVSIPGKNNGKEKDDGSEDSRAEEAEKKSEVVVDEACWIYEQLSPRRLAQDLSHPLITMLQQECSRASCPEMKAGEWLYLCVAHGNDGAMEQCCAIDYILHTLDSATVLLNSPRAFPSRLQIPQTSHRHFSSLARRLGRIFAHAYFHHREAFEQAEAESSLYARFLALTSKFGLVPPEFLVIPSSRHNEHRRDMDVQPPRLLAAAVDPQGDRNRQASAPHDDASSNMKWTPALSGSQRESSSSPPAPGSESPRKFGRSRTDTMIFNEAEVLHVAEELAKSNDEPANPPTASTDVVPPSDDSNTEAPVTSHENPPSVIPETETPTSDNSSTPDTEDTEPSLILDPEAPPIDQEPEITPSSSTAPQSSANVQIEIADSPTEATAPDPIAKADLDVSASEDPEGDESESRDQPASAVAVADDESAESDITESSTLENDDQHILVALPPSPPIEPVPEVEEAVSQIDALNVPLPADLAPEDLSESIFLDNEESNATREVSAENAPPQLKPQAETNDDGETAADDHTATVSESDTPQLHVTPAEAEQASLSTVADDPANTNTPEEDENAVTDKIEPEGETPSS